MQQQPPQQQQEEMMRTLWMGAVQPHWDEAFLFSLFANSKETVPLAIKLIRPSYPSQPVGYAFIDFDSHETAQFVLTHFNGQPIPNTNGVYFRLNWSSGSGGRKMALNNNNNMMNSGGAGGGANGMAQPQLVGQVSTSSGSTTALGGASSAAPSTSTAAAAGSSTAPAASSSSNATVPGTATTTILSNPMMLQQQQQQQQPQEYSVFVGDLAPEVTDHVLYETFAATFSSVRNAKVVTDPTTGSSKGYGFVRFLDKAQCDESMQIMNGVYLGSRAIRVSSATRRPQQQQQQHSQVSAGMGRPPSPRASPSPLGGGVPNSSSSVRPANAPRDSISSSIGNEEEGNARGSAASQSRASVSPTTGAGTQQQQQQPNAVGSPPASPAPRSSSLSSGTIPPSVAPPPPPENTTVFVGNLDSNVTDSQLQHHFAKFGKIVQIKIPPNRGCGFVKFETRESAERAISALHGSILGGLRIRLDWGKSGGGAGSGGANNNQINHGNNNNNHAHHHQQQQQQQHLHHNGAGPTHLAPANYLLPGSAPGFAMGMPTQHHPGGMMLHHAPHGGGAAGMLGPNGSIVGTGGPGGNAGAPTVMVMIPSGGGAGQYVIQQQQQQQPPPPLPQHPGGGRTRQNSTGSQGGGGGMVLVSGAGPNGPPGGNMGVAFHPHPAGGYVATPRGVSSGGVINPGIPVMSANDLAHVHQQQQQAQYNQYYAQWHALQQQQHSQQGHAGGGAGGGGGASGMAHMVAAGAPGYYRYPVPSQPPPAHHFVQAMQPLPNVPPAPAMPTYAAVVAHPAPASSATRANPGAAPFVPAAHQQKESAVTASTAAPADGAKRETLPLTAHSSAPAVVSSPSEEGTGNASLNSGNANALEGSSTKKKMTSANSAPATATNGKSKSGKTSSS